MEDMFQIFKNLRDLSPGGQKYCEVFSELAVPAEQ